MFQLVLNFKSDFISSSESESWSLFLLLQYNPHSEDRCKHCLLGQSTVLYVGYDRKGVLRTGTGYRICPNSIPVLVTGTGIYFLPFRFRSIRNRNFKSLFWFRLNRKRKLEFTGFQPEFTGIHFPKNLFYLKSVYYG